MGGKAKRARERARVATRKETLERVGQWIESGELLDGDNERLYHSCNLMPMISEHDEKCNGHCPELSSWEVAIVYEKESIRDMGADPDSINSNPLITDVRLDALVDWLVEKEVIDRDGLELKMRQAMYNKLKSLRENDLPSIIAEHKLRQARAKILGPANGRQQ